MFKKLKKLCALFLVLSIFFSTSETFALTGVTSSKVTAFGQGKINNEANFVQFQQTVTGCTFNRAYINYEDKEVFAAALTGASQNLLVGALIDTAAPGKTMDTHGPTPMTCRVVSLWIVGY